MQTLVDLLIDGRTTLFLRGGPPNLNETYSRRLG